MKVNFKNKKYFVFDMDGTLALHRSAPISNQNKELLQRIIDKNNHLIILSSGSCERLLKQLNENSTLLGEYVVMGNYGLDIIYVSDGKIIKSHSNSYYNELDLDKINNSIREIIKLKNLPTSIQNLLIFDSGLIVFPVLGNASTNEEKNAFDPLKNKRLEVVNYLKTKMPDFNYFISGRTSIDILKAGINKYTSIKKYCLDNKISFDQVVFFGDQFDVFENDRPILDGYLMEKLIDFCKVKNAHLPKDLFVS